MPISALPTPPSRSDSPQDFSDRADALLGALPGFVTEANALQSDVNAKEASVSSYATIATDKAAEAQGHATTASTKASEAAAAAVAAAAAASNAEIAFDSFDDKYLGSKAGDPATDNDGNPLLTGALYWNTSVGAVRVWNGAAWLSMAADASIVDFQQAGAGAVVRTAQDKLREVVSVKDFGAVGDGVADDTAAFNNTPAGIVCVPAGTYRLNGWAPKSNTKYVFSSGAVLTQHSVLSPIVSLPNGSQNIVFDGGRFVGDTASSAGAIAIFDTQGVLFRNRIIIKHATFDGFGGMALVLGGAKGVLVTGCVFRNTAQLNMPTGTVSYPAIWCSDNQNLSGYDQATDISITECVFEDMFWSGVYALGQRIKINDCEFRNTRESAIFISQFASNVLVNNNTIDTTTQQHISASGVEVGGQYVTVAGNRITNCSLFGISVQDAQFFSVASNLLSFNQDGIAIITTSSTAPPRYGAVKNNTVTNSTGRGLRFIRTGSGALIQDCDISENYVTTSGIRSIEFSSSTGLVSANSFVNLNSAETRQPLTAEANLQSLTVGTDRVLLTSPFRPRAIEASFVNPGASSRLCVSRAVFDVSGAISQGSQSVSESGAAIDMINFVSLPGIFSAEITGVSYNTTSFVWEVICQVNTNAGVAVWGNFTVFP